MRARQNSQYRHSFAVHDTQFTQYQFHDPSPPPAAPAAAAATSSDGVYNNSSTSNSSTSAWHTRQSSRSLSPKLKFDPFAPSAADNSAISVSPRVNPRNLSDVDGTVVNQGSSGLGRNGFAKEGTFQFNVNEQTMSSSTLGWSKVWGKSSGLTTSVWG
jgi:hypothetical protein